ncbi:hypothetical protein JT358_01300 [Micrococcales bacterium 31B]|nr:hypothetical protein [Micrococcales bacterium 31B]
MSDFDREYSVAMRRRALWGGPLAAVQALIGGYLLCVIVVVLGFVLSLSGGVPVPETLRSSVSVWLAGHGAGYERGEVSTTLIPLLLLGAFIVLTFRAARRAGRAAELFTDRGQPRDGTARDALLIVLTYAITYTTVLALITPVTLTASDAPDIGRGVALAGIMSVLVSIAGVLDSGRGKGAPDWYTLLRQTLSWEYALGLRAGRHMLLWLAILASLVLVIDLAVTAPEQLDLLRALNPGWAGITALVAGTLLFAPNLIVWTLAAISGPGFSFGTETSFGIQGVTSNVLPAIPVLAALPAEGSGGGWWLALAAVPAVAGAVGAVYAVRDSRNAATLWHVAMAILTGALFAGSVVAVVVYLSSGGLLGGALSQIGANAWAVGGMVALETSVGGLALLGVAVTGWVPPLRDMLQGLVFEGSTRRPRRVRTLTATSLDVDGGLDRVIGDDGEIGSAAREQEPDFEDFYDDGEERELNAMETTALTQAQAIVLTQGSGAAASESSTATGAGPESPAGEPDAEPAGFGGPRVTSAKYDLTGVASARSEDSIAAEVLGLTTTQMKQEHAERQFQREE